MHFATSSLDVHRRERGDIYVQPAIKKNCRALDLNIISDTNPCAQEGAPFFFTRHERPTANYSAMDAHDDVMTGEKNAAVF